MGKITLVTSHQQCADRCTEFSAHGCKGFMTGMVNHMLLCRSYGGNKLAAAGCADWAAYNHPGINSGQLGSLSQRTYQCNVGGSCCTNSTVVRQSSESGCVHDLETAAHAAASPAAPSTAQDSDEADTLAGANIVYITLILAVIVLACLIIRRRGGAPVAQMAAPHGEQDAHDRPTAIPAATPEETWV